MDRRAIIRRRFGAQRLFGRPLAAPGDAVAWLGAMQAQEYAEAKWSIAQRMAGCTDDDVEAAFARGDLLRTHVLRPTWHFATPADIRWLLALTGPRVQRQNAYMYRQTGLDDATLGRSTEVLEAALRDGEPRTRKELAGSLAAAGIETDGMRLAYVMMWAELEALICSGPRRGSSRRTRCSRSARRRWRRSSATRRWPSWPGGSSAAAARPPSATWRCGPA